MKKYFKILVSFILACTLFTSSAGALELTYSEKKNLPGLDLPIDESLIVKNGIFVKEAEDMNYGNVGRYMADEKGSGGAVVSMPTTQWYIEKTTKDDLWTDFYIEKAEDAGNYRLWYRARTTHTDSGSVWLNPNTGVWAANYYSSLRDGEYRWTSANITLHEGKNTLAFRSRTSGMIDKVIVTNDFGFTPEGKDDVPVYMTEEEKEALWRTYWKEPDLKPISGHPRLLVTKDFLPTLRQNMQSDELLWMKNKFYKYAYEELNCKLDTTKANNHNAFLLTKIMSRCLVWLMGDETNPAHARQTINYMKDYLETVRTPDDTGDITRSRGNILYTAAIVYDWLYSELTQEDKDYFVDKMITVVLSKEIGWPPTHMSDISTHAGEQEIFRDLLGAGIAIYDEYPLLYDLAAGRMFEKFIPARKWLRNTGRFDQGHDYSLCRSYSELWADMTMQRMGYPSIYDGTLHKALKYRIDARMPYGAMIPNGDMYSLTRSEFKLYYCDYILTMCLAGNMYKDPNLKLEFKRSQSIADIDEYSQFFILLFTDPEVKTATWDNWNLAKYTTYPLSGLIARTSWQEGFNSDAAMAMVDMHEVYVGDHQFVYTGDFQLYYKGLLAMRTGTYNASNQHNEGYSHRAIAGNTMLCYDPDETFKASWGKDSHPVQNDGGQRLPYDGGSAVNDLEELQIDENNISQNKELEVAKNVKHYIGPNTETPEFSYISGDLTSAYTDKVTEYKRGTVFMDLDNSEYPAAFVVYDKMESKKADFKKVWLLHSEEKPEVHGTTTVIERKQNGFGGRLVNKTMIPSAGNSKIDVVGDEGTAMFTINGYNYGVKQGAIEAGKYRIELSPKLAQKSDTFLNAMYVTDAGNTKELPMLKESQGSFVGVTVMNKTVLFEKNFENVQNSFTLNVRNNGYDTMSVLVNGVAPGVWTVTGNGRTQNIEVTEDGCALMFKGAPGRYTIAKAAEGTKADEITYEKMSKRAIGDFLVWMSNPEKPNTNNGNYLFLEKPTKIIDGKAYLPAEALKEYGASVTVSGNNLTVSTETGTAYITADNSQYKIDDNSYTFKSVPKALGGTVYVDPTELSDLLGYKFTYKGDLSKILYSIKKEQ